ncbi:hypothetical protein ACSZM6_00620 [Aeromonas caviae]|uniref:hypothetical protein n=1 Tax=Aeromonas caviae TaxID=648 RepID=UPI003EC94E76
MMKNADMPAMPVSGSDGQPIDVFSLTYGRGSNLVSSGMTVGMTKREMMAMHFSAALMNNPNWDDMTQNDVAMFAVGQADATLRALEE